MTVLAIVVTWHYWILYSDLTGAREDLLTIRAYLRDVGLDMSSTDLDIARQRTKSADTRLQRADTHLRFDPVLQVARHLPWTGTQVNAADDFVDMAQLLTDIADEATIAGEQAVELRESPPPDQPLTASLVQLLTDVRPSLLRIQELTDELVDLRLRGGDDALLPPLASARDQLDEELPRIANGVDQAVMAQQLLPGLLGFEGERRYLVFPLNNGELLPGGGLVTAAGILPVTEGVNGDVDFTDSTRWKSLWEAKGGVYIEPPGPLKRYLLRDFTWNLLVANWTPDFPTWSQQAAEFYELVHGEQPLDGIIAVDLHSLERLLAVTGPQTIEVEGHGNVTFTENNAVLELERLTRRPFDPESDRKSVIGDLTEAILADLLHLPSEKWTQAINTVRDLGSERHIQVLSYHPEEQTLVRDVSWDGSLVSPRGDYLHFNEASLNSTKLNLVIQPEGTYRIDINELGDARHELVFTYKNTLPEWSKGKDPQLVEHLMLGGLYGSYLRVFGPLGMTSFTAELNGAPMGIEDLGEEHGKQWYGVFMSLPSGHESQLRFRWSSPLAATGSDRYDLYLQKQPGTKGVCLDMQVTRAGRAASSLEIKGGRRDEQGRVCLTTDVRLTAKF